MFGFDDPEYLRDQLQQAQAAAYESEEQHRREVAKLTEERDRLARTNIAKTQIIEAMQRGVALFNTKYGEWKAEIDVLTARLVLAQRTTIQCANVAERACAQLAAQKSAIDCARALAFEVRESRMMNLRDLRHEIEKLDKVRPS